MYAHHSYWPLHLAHFIHWCPHDSPSNMGQRDPSFLNFLSLALMPYLSEFFWRVESCPLPPVCPFLLRPCIYPNLSHRVGLLENEAPWEIPDQNGVLGESWLTSLETFLDLSPKLLLLHQPYQVDEDFHVALLRFLVTRKPRISQNICLSQSPNWALEKPLALHYLVL